MVNHLEKIWRGEVSLARTYWLNGFLISIILNILFELAIPSLLGTPDILFLGFAGFYLIFGAFLIWITGGIFRAASLYDGPKMAARMARLTVLGVWFVYVKWVLELTGVL